MFASKFPCTPSLLLSGTVLLLLSGCGGGGGGGGSSFTVLAEIEPNDTPATARAFTTSSPAGGEVFTAGDVDFWKLSLIGGDVVQIEIFGTRLDQDTWDTNGNVPRLTLFDTDGTTKLLEHDFGGFTSGGWSGGPQDLDMPLFRVPVNGVYYVCVTQDDPGLDGGSYVVRVTRLNLGPLQVEAEAETTSGVNDSFGTAETITPGILRGYHVDDEEDWYTFTIAAPAIVTFEMTTYRNGVFAGDDEYYDPEIKLFDTDGTTELLDEDDAYFYDSQVRYHLDAAGTYFLNVGEYATSAGDARYFLTFTSTDKGAIAESEPNDTSVTADPIAYDDVVTGNMNAGETDLFAFVGAAGDMVRVELFDTNNANAAADTVDVQFIDTDGTTQLTSDGFSNLQVRSTILQSTGIFYVRVTPDLSPGPTSYAIHLTRFKSAVPETEPNDTQLAANLLDLNGRAAGVIDTSGDIDTYKFLGNAGRLVTIVIYADDENTGGDGFGDFAGYGSDMDPLLTILDGSATVLATSVCAPASAYAYTEGVVDGLPTAQVSFVVPSTNVYYLTVEDQFAGGSADRYYVIEKK